MQISGRKDRMDVADHGRRIGGKIKQHCTRRHAGNQAVGLVQCHCFNLSWSGQGRHDQFRTGCQLPWSIGPFGTCRQMRVCVITTNVVYGNLCPGLDKVGRKMRTHGTQADKSDLLHPSDP